MDIQKQNELMKGTLYSIIHNAYPTDLFPPITTEQWKEIHQCIHNRLGIPIDRLSAEYGRLLRKPLIEEAEECLKRINNAKDKK